MRDEQGGQLRLAESHADPEAGHARLSDLELRLANAVPVADAHFVVTQRVDGEVLPEGAVLQVVPAEVFLPVVVGLDLVDEHGALLATVPVEVALAVTVDIEPPHQAWPLDGPFPDTRVHGAPLPGDGLGKADVDRQQGRHGAYPLPVASDGRGSCVCAGVPASLHRS